MMLPAKRNVSNIHQSPPKRELVTTEPNPGRRLIPLLGWLKKRGAVRYISQCNLKWKEIDIEDEVKRLGTDLICIYRMRGGKKVIRLENTPWADQWLAYYNAEVPHHGQPEKTKIKFLDTERKV